MQINKISPFMRFHSPRDLCKWDKYDFENRFFSEWVEYNRIVVSVGTSYEMHCGFLPN